METLSLSWGGTLAAGQKPAHAQRVMTREDHRRLHELVLAQGDFVTRSLRNLGVVGGDLDDCVQKVFLVAARRLHDIQPGKERAFLFSCAQNTAAHFRRTLARRREVPDDLLPESAAPQFYPERLLQQKRARLLLDQVLAGMEDTLRAVFVLYVFEEMTMAEVARVLDLPAGTVASRLRRARQVFRDEVTRLELREGQESA